MGTATMNDRCTTIGPSLIDRIITIPPGGLSTWKPPVNEWYDNYDMYTIGEVWQDPSGDFNGPIAYGIARLNLKDLACPTWGLGRSTSIDSTIITTIGPPWLPLIVPPTEIFSLDPVWASHCTGLLTDQFALTTFALFDPPIALTPAAMLLSTSLVYSEPTPVPVSAGPTTTSERAIPSRNYPEPASVPAESIASPAKTKDTGEDVAIQSLARGSADASPMPDSPAASSKAENEPPLDPSSSSKLPWYSTAPGDPLAIPIVSSSTGSDQPSYDPQKLPSSTRVPSYSAVHGNPLAESIAPSSSALDPPSSGLRTSPSNTKVYPLPAVPEHPSAISLASSSSVLSPPLGHSQKLPSDPKMDTQGIGAIIYNAFGKQEPDGDGIASTVHTLSLPAQIIFTMDAQTFTANPTGFIVNSAAISAGGTPHKIDGIIVDLNKFKPSTTDAFTVADQTFTPNPSGFSIDGTTISVDGPAATISGIVVSLGQSGVLAIGSSTISLPTQSYAPNKVYTIAGQPFTPNPSAFPIANTVISAGGPAATINGTIITLRPSGILLIGTSTIPLLTTPAPKFPSSDIDTDIDGFDVKAESSSIVIIDGMTLTAGAAGATLSGGQAISLEAGGATLDIGTRRVASPTAVSTVVNGSSIDTTQAFTGGGQGKGKGTGLVSWLLVVCGTLFVLMMI